jgi:tryptophan-rich sensory protein
MIVLASLFILNRQRISKQKDQGGNSFRLIILPSYFEYIFAMIIACLLMGIIDVVGRRPLLRQMVKFGISRLLSEGLTFFLMQHGAGYYAMRVALLYAIIWSLLCVAVLYAVGVPQQKEKHNNLTSAEFYGHAILYGGIFLFYLMLLTCPLYIIYRRPALRFFSVVQMILFLLDLIVITLIWLEDEIGYCIKFTSNILITGVIFPLIVFYTLAKDSEVSYPKTSSHISFIPSPSPPHHHNHPSTQPNPTQ